MQSKGLITAFASSFSDTCFTFVYRNRDSVASKPPRILNKPTSSLSGNNVQPQCRQDDFDDFDPRLDDFDPRLDDFNPRESSASGKRP